MDIMDEFAEMKGYFIVINNVPIHVPGVIDPVILNRGYVPVKNNDQFDFQKSHKLCLKIMGNWVSQK